MDFSQGFVGLSRKPTTRCSICAAKMLQVTRPRGLVGLFDFNILSYLPVVANQHFDIAAASDWLCFINVQWQQGFAFLLLWLLF